MQVKEEKVIYFDSSFVKYQLYVMSSFPLKQWVREGCEEVLDVCPESRGLKLAASPLLVESTVL